MFLVGPGFLLNYALLYSAGILLPLDGFGIFYTSISIINILFAPAVMLGFFYSRRITTRLVTAGLAQALAEFRSFVRQLLRWGSVATAGVIIILLIAGLVIGIESYELAVFIALAAFGSYLAESTRAGLQGLNKLITVGFASLAWLTVRFAFSVTGLYAGGTALAGIAGIVLAAIVVFIGYYYFIVRLEPAVSLEPDYSPVEPLRLFIFMTSFALYSITVYIDILAAYIGFDRVDLGVYSASAVLPKSLIVLSMPVVQVLYPVMVSERTVGGSGPTSLIKGFVLTFLVTGAGAAILLLFDDMFCDGLIGIKSCNADYMEVLVFGALPICLLRVLVLSKLAAGDDWHPMLLAVFIAAFIGYIGFVKPGPAELAESYFVFSWLTLLIYSFACFLRIRGDMPPGFEETAH